MTSAQLIDARPRITAIRTWALAIVSMLVLSLGAGGVLATAASGASGSSRAAVSKKAAAKKRAAAKKKAAAKKQALAKKRAAAKKAKEAATKKQQQAAAASGVSEIPVTFTVRNTNTSLVPCAADGKTYEVKGHIVGPAAKLASTGPKAAALYVHGLSYGEFFWNFKGAPGYNYAAQQATDAGLISVAIDRLGYGASGKPDGNQVCYGSEADYLHQIVNQLRSGQYGAGSAATGPTFGKIALVGHSAGGFMAEATASSYKNVDALITAGFSNAPTGAAVVTAFLQNTIDCYTGALPNHYAFFGKTPADFQAGHFFNAEPAVQAAVTAVRTPDPCGDTASVIPSVLIDVLSNNSIKVPTLIVNGGNDAFFPPPDGDLEKSLFLGNPDVTQTTIPQTGHAVTFGRTAPQFRATVANWLVKRGY